MNYKELLEDNQPVYFENERFLHFKNELISERYFANYLSYKTMPNLADFQSDMAYLADEQRDYPSNFSFVFFMEMAELSDELRLFLLEQGFELEKHIIFTNQLVNLNLVERGLGDIRIASLDETWLAKYLELKYQQALPYGKSYAEQMLADNRKKLLSNGSKFYLAVKDDQIIGDVTAWVHGDFIEIDDFSVDEKFRGQGIGTNLQLETSRGFDKVILLSEEGNRAVYEHQGYQEVSHYWTALRVSKENSDGN
ncbi:GNAT family N-acetyltransferase [Streptococcus sp. HF-1907]|uniref:GNAT family N-acetyltransferase n=1 Tax=Streptococcus sp. HF-1907 TaxID=2785793 RepID=UPI00189E6679|nr:GNAT family N-acetyltransferase [Streptococcus sp. HF-1907]MBF7095477.1 GNAT family N-acetyltransferase [Streptococcus sp. HF-1907]